jgi:hypothetical protein
MYQKYPKKCLFFDIFRIAFTRAQSSLWIFSQQLLYKSLDLDQNIIKIIYYIYSYPSHDRN